MHDPMTVAFQIKSPINRKSEFFKEGFRNTWVTIWHIDPEKDNTDDSCGWFMRSRHGDKAVLERIVKRFEWDWDRVFKSEDTGREYFCGYFYPENAGAGMPNMGVTAIVINLFFIAALEYFNCGGQWKKAKRFMQRNLFEIMFFAENPTDSLRDEIIRKWGQETKREERIRNVAHCIYGWILRQERPWYRHPRWHVHHWRVDWHFGRKVWRWLFSRCAICKKRFRYNESVIGNWDGDKIWHHGCDQQLQPQKDTCSPGQ